MPFVITIGGGLPIKDISRVGGVVVGVKYRYGDDIDRWTEYVWLYGNFDGKYPVNSNLRQEPPYSQQLVADLDDAYEV